MDEITYLPYSRILSDFLIPVSLWPIEMDAQLISVP